MYKTLLLSATAGVSAYYVYLAPHTVFLENHRRIVSTYRLSKEIPVAKEHQQWFKEVVEDLKLPNNTRKLIRPFNVYGFEIYHAGTLDYKYGAILGLPVNFSYKSVDDVNKSDIMLKGQYPEWETEDGQNFLNSLILSENAQKFAMAREILRLQTGETQINARNLACAIVALMMSCHVAKEKLKEARTIFRRSVYGVLFLMAAGLQIACKDYYSRKFDAENDNALSEMGPKYVEGGKEFYEKLLLRNVALRGLLGEEGEQYFAADGNEKVSLRQKGMPVRDRRSIFDKKLQHMA